MIPVLSTLKENKIAFLRTSGVVYNALMTKRFKDNSGLDVSTFDIESWILGESHFSPSWRNLLMILENMGFRKYASRIEKYLDTDMPRTISQEQESDDVLKGMS